MAEDAPNYRRLPGTGYRYRVPGWTVVLLFFVIGIFVLLLRRRIQLWLGPEHLLSVDSDGYREEYKRFDYRNIQAIILRKTRQGAIANVVLAIVVAVFGGSAFAAADPVVRGILLFIAGFFGLLLLINALRGPTCQCRLLTAVHSLDLVSLTRLRTARKALERISPFIEQAQGPIRPVPADLTGEAAGGMGEMQAP